MKKLIVFITLVIAISILATGYMFYLSAEKSRNLRVAEQILKEQREKEIQEKIVQEKWANQTALNLCLAAAADSYKERWDGTADSRGLNQTYNAEIYDRDYKNMKDECFRRWK